MASSHETSIKYLTAHLDSLSCKRDELDASLSEIKAEMSRVNAAITCISQTLDYLQSDEAAEIELVDEGKSYKKPDELKLTKFRGMSLPAIIVQVFEEVDPI
jgi:chromosome segregation ATPase